MSKSLCSSPKAITSAGCKPRYWVSCANPQPLLTPRGIISTMNGILRMTVKRLPNSASACGWILARFSGSPSNFTQQQALSDHKIIRHFLRLTHLNPGMVFPRLQNRILADVTISRIHFASRGNKDRKEVANRLKDLFNAPTYDQAVERRDQLVKDWQTEFPKVVKKLENSFDELMVIYQLPEELRKRLRTNNTIERVNQEIRRRDRVIRIFPNDLSVLRLMGALLIEQNEKWAAGPRYLNMTVYHGIEKDDNSEEAGMLKLVK